MMSPMIIPMHTGGHVHLTIEDAKFLLEMWVLMNLVWVISLFYGFIPAIKERKKRVELNKKYNYSEPYETNILKLWYKEREWSMLGFFDLSILIIWATCILFILGKSVSTLF